MRRLHPSVFVMIAVTILLVSLVMLAGGNDVPGAALAILSFVLLMVVRFIIRPP